MSEITQNAHNSLRPLDPVYNWAIPMGLMGMVVYSLLALIRNSQFHFKKKDDESIEA